MLKGKNTYFASMNSTEGFVSHFQSIFDPCKLERIYILKGGPGTGKSSLIKSIAAKAEALGLPFELFLCSSDPNSLDGILLPENKVAVLDGTSPHTTDPIYPGVVENIINLGSFWKSEKLKDKKSEILALIKEKSKAYKQGYQFLISYGEIAKEILALAESALLTEKMEKNIRRQAKYFFKDDVGSAKIRNTKTICADGFQQTDSFSENANRIWIIEDHAFSSHLYLMAMKEYALENKQEVLVSLSPIFPSLPNGLYFPKSKTALVVGNKSDDNAKVYRFINMNRFLNQDHIHDNKQKIKFGEKCLKMLLQGAKEAFGKASDTHQKLEHFYTAAMDFNEVENTRTMLDQEIFS